MKDPERAQTISVTAGVPVEKEKRGDESSAMTPFSSHYQSVTSEADRSMVKPQKPPHQPQTTQDDRCQEDASQRSTCLIVTNIQVQQVTAQLSISRKGNIWTNRPFVQGWKKKCLEI